MIKLWKKTLCLLLMLLMVTSVSSGFAASVNSVFVLKLPEGVNLNPQTVCREAFCIQEAESLSEILITDVLFYPGTLGQIKLFSEEVLPSLTAYQIEATGILDENGEIVSFSQTVVPGLEFETALEDVFLQGVSEQKTQTGRSISIKLTNSSKASYPDLDCYLVLYQGNKVIWLNEQPFSLSGEQSDSVTFEEIPDSVSGWEQRKILVFDRIQSLHPILNSGYDIENNFIGG